MAPPKRSPAGSHHRTAPNSSTAAPTPAAAAGPSSAMATTTSQNPLAILSAVYKHYLATTPQRTKLIDAFLAFLVVTGVLQFLYCVLAGNYPFNAFLAGFSATVGQFVLTASLRIQSNPQNKKSFESVSPERAFADYIFGSVILHFFCINFIN